jgi:hypothetical protein
MRNRISNTSSYYPTPTTTGNSDTRSSTSGSHRSFQTSGQLSHFASRLSAAGEPHSGRTSVANPYTHAYTPATYVSEYGSAASSVYESASAGSLSRAASDISSIRSGSSDLFELNLNRSARFSEAGSDLFEIDLHGAGQSFAAGNHRRSELGASLSQAGTPTERSFHLSERDSVGSALRNGRLGYSSASSRRLTSYEGSSAAGSVVSSYHDSLTPSDRSALRNATALGRFAPADLHPSEHSMDSEYHAYLQEGDDVVAPLRASRFRPIPSVAPSAPYSVESGSMSRRLSRTPSFSGRIDDNHRPRIDSDGAGSDSDGSGRFGRADVESLAAAGAGPSSGRQHRQLWELLQEEH